MDYLKRCKEYQRQIIEAIFVGFIGGWALTSILRETYEHIAELEFSAQKQWTSTIFMLLLCSAAMVIIYKLNDRVARIIMFVFVYAFIVMCAYNANSIDWLTIAKNSIGKVCYAGVLCFVATIAFLYVKKDIFALFSKLKLNKKLRNILIAVIGVTVFAFVGYVTVMRYLTYSNSTFDFGIFAQMFEYMKNKGTVETTLERGRLLSHFGVHFSPVFYVFLPIYFIFPSPITVQLIQAAAIALPVIPITLLCRRYKMSHWMTVAINALYILYPATSGGAMYDIHENCFLTFLVLMVVWAVESRKDVWLSIFTLLTLFVKEDAAIYILVLGAYFLFSKREKKRGLVLMLVALVYFAIAIAIVNSYGLGTLDNRFYNYYFDKDGGMIQIVQTLLTNPGYVMTQFITNSSAEGAMDKIEYIIIMLVPFAGVLFTTGKKYSRYILLVPFILFNVSTTYLYMHNVGYQYNFGVIALFMYITIMNLSEKKIVKAKTMIGVSVICVSLFFMVTQFTRIEIYSDRYEENEKVYQQMNEAIALVPEDASVRASGFITPHLTKNLVLYDQDHKDEEGFIDKSVLTDYLVIDRRYSLGEKFYEQIQTGRYELIYNAEGVIQVYKLKQQ